MKPCASTGLGNTTLHRKPSMPSSSRRSGYGGSKFVRRPRAPRGSLTDITFEHLRRGASAAWRGPEALGAVLRVGRTRQVGDEVGAVTGTLADATQTVLAYRAPVGSDLFLALVDPPGGASGRSMGALLVAPLPAAERSM